MLTIILIGPKSYLAFIGMGISILVDLENSEKSPNASSEDMCILPFLGIYS